jgi:hypothetical protein
LWAEFRRGGGSGVRRRLAVETGIVAAVGIDAQLEGGDGGEIDGVVFQLFGGSRGAEVPLLADDFAKL